MIIFDEIYLAGLASLLQYWWWITTLFLGWVMTIIVFIIAIRYGINGIKRVEKYREENNEK